MKEWWKSGSPWVWLSAAAVSASFLMVFGILSLITYRGLSYFWPSPVHQFQFQLPEQKAYTVIGEIFNKETIDAKLARGTGTPIPADQQQATRILIKTGNKAPAGNQRDFHWEYVAFIQSRTLPPEAVVIERREWGNAYGYFDALKENGQPVATEQPWNELQKRIERAEQLFQQQQAIEKNEMGSINYQLERLRLTERGLDLKNALTPEAKAELEQQRAALNSQTSELRKKLQQIRQQLNRDSMELKTANDQTITIALSNVVRAYRPNEMSLLSKLGFYATKFWEFISDEPREANTEGGIFPAIFGTVMMVIVMSVLVTPFGVVAAVYLKEYAKQGPLTRLIRIAVNNLAGVPSIVYGVFGLGFFVYFIGNSLDRVFFPEALPAPTFGTPGILWASLTLALLTLPVVIVATEEGLTRIPKSIREASYALGTTKFETIWRVVLPMASPALMTGLILAVARAAGEVAPLMLVGVVKLAPTMPLDGNFPYIHLERKIMHLGFHIYDVGFQSPNVEAARPLVYATAMLLVLVILILNLAAIAIRNHLREKYRAIES